MLGSCIFNARECCVFREASVCSGIYSGDERQTMILVLWIKTGYLDPYACIWATSTPYGLNQMVAAGECKQSCLHVSANQNINQHSPMAVV